MATVHILIFVEMAGFEIVPFIATNVKIIVFFFMELWKKKKKKNAANQNSPICMKTTDIKLFIYEPLFHVYVIFCHNLFKTVVLTLSSIYTHFNTLKKNALGKRCGKR